MGMYINNNSKGEPLGTWNNTYEDGSPLPKELAESLSLIANSLAKDGFLIRPDLYRRLPTFGIGTLTIKAVDGDPTKWAFYDELADYDTTRDYALDDIDALVSDILKCKAALLLIKKKLLPKT